MTSRTTLRLAALLMALPALGMAVGAKRAVGRLQQPLAVLADAPDRWIPFTAEVIVTKPDSNPVVGRFYRASDGSRRLDSGPAVDDVRVAYILNVPDASVFTFSPRWGWTVQTTTEVVAGRTGEYRPTRVMPVSPDWVPYTHRLAIRKGESGSLAAASGFRALLMNDPTGTSRLLVPELNLFAVVMKTAEGRSEEYRNVQIGEPSADLFRPPAGAVITRVNPSAGPRH